MTGSVVASIVFLLGALILAWRGLQSHGVSTERKFWMAGLWALIIAGLAFILSHIGV
ncbi:hypothetical protein GCM10011371_05710 [Novosphingobium marinum]|uniref:Na+-transporting NADH:ubiquinone oxidoreductase subunit NqrB n=1 Tax=Novosphingobium marinum TaxID=1514948 RepID=A0A7Y9XTG4_9SPHN|nr:hypothetical protein [Novosphingobium marinum]NYH94259.1 Na+-transporting NADH:ubiquinone oxidoreductase subunit NqrB [Novosphingobium marinum]GGC20941.1 hypothetical protein GCM10011371_05710 [Novosphingobium marinum]